MKTRILLAIIGIFFSWTTQVFALEKGFDINEAKDMLDLCINLNGNGMKEGDGEICPDSLEPAHWDLVFDSYIKKDKEIKPCSKKYDKVSGFGPYSNRWKLWRYKDKKDVYAIVIRGTVGDVASIKEDFLATSLDGTCINIPYRGTNHDFVKSSFNNSIPDSNILVPTLEKRGVCFKLAATPGSEVHAGFCYGLAVIMFDKNRGILKQLSKLPANSQIYITGHSQGAALATLAHAFLYYAENEGGPSGRRFLDKNFSFKSYVFAQPKPGNWQFAMDYAENIGNKGLSYTINNVYDGVPQVPLSIQHINNAIESVSSGHPIIYFFMKSIDSIKRFFSSSINSYFSNKDIISKDFDEKNYVHKIKDLGKSGDTLNYMPVGNIIAVKPSKNPPLNGDVLREHHLGTYKKLLENLKGVQL